MEVQKTYSKSYQWINDFVRHNLQKRAPSLSFSFEIVAHLRPCGTKGCRSQPFIVENVDAFGFIVESEQGLIAAKHQLAEIPILEDLTY